jgi:DNA-binding MarR family transcriptional regulator
MIFALRDFDNHGTGLRVKEVATILNVDPTFVTTQSKLLEANGFVSRNASSEDGRVVRLSLTDKTLKQLADLSIRQKKINDYILSEFTDPVASVCHEGCSRSKTRWKKPAPLP